jgi:hypothetical protein
MKSSVGKRGDFLPCKNWFDIAKLRAVMETSKQRITSKNFDRAERA